MSTEQPAYEITAHQRARNELNQVPEPQQTDLRKTIREAAHKPKPTETRNVERLTGVPFLKAKVDGYRGILEFDKPELRLLLVDKRRVVYDRLDVAQERAQA